MFLARMQGLRDPNHYYSTRQLWRPLSCERRDIAMDVVYPETILGAIRIMSGQSTLSLNQVPQWPLFEQSTVYPYHPSPHPSSSAVSFGLRSIFLATTGFAAGFFAVVVDDLLRPFGSGLDGPGFFAFAASHSAKSGSVPSSKGAGLATAAALFDDVDGFVTAPSSSSKSPIFPHESPPSSPSSSCRKA